MSIEAALLGTAAASATSTAAATAATAGLFGTGGSFALGSTLSTLSGIASLVGGVQGMQAGKEQAKLANQQAGMAAAEQVRQSERAARFEQEAIDATTRRQKLAYLASGVTLSGSPLLVMEETRRRGADNIDEILQGGRASSAAALSEGRVRATQFKSQGREAFTQGLFGAGQAAAKVFA